MPIKYRIVTDNAGLNQIAQLEQVIWGRATGTTTPSVIMRFTTLNGGVAIGAYDDADMIGMSWACPIRRDSETALWSHITGVLPDYRRQAIGIGLKSTQRAWALANGYERIYWTFDPMQSLNAHFNLRLLGAYAQTYHDNYYGEITDKLNTGLPTDRLEAIWVLNDQRVALATAESRVVAYTEAADSLESLVSVDGNTLNSAPLNHLSAPAYWVETPQDFGKTISENPDMIQQWQAAIRDIMLHALQRGYVVADFVREPHRCGYVLLSQTAYHNWQAVIANTI